MTMPYRRKRAQPYRKFIPEEHYCERCPEPGRIRCSRCHTSATQTRDASIPLPAQTSHAKYARPVLLPRKDYLKRSSDEVDARVAAFEATPEGIARRKAAEVLAKAGVKPRPKRYRQHWDERERERKRSRDPERQAYKKAWAAKKSRERELRQAALKAAMGYDAALAQGRAQALARRLKKAFPDGLPKTVLDSGDD